MRFGRAYRMMEKVKLNDMHHPERLKRMDRKPTYEELETRIKDLTAENATLRAAREEFTANEEMFSQIVDGTPIATFVIDEDHRITHCNKAWENLTGIPAAELLGTRRHWQTFYAKPRPVMADLVVDNAPEETFAQYYKDKCRKSSVIEGAYEAENFFPALGDSGKWLFFTASPIRDESGRITGAIETLQDITERKRAEEKHRNSERRFRSFLEFLPYPIVVFTVDGRVFYLNPAFTDTFGWTLDELKGERIPYVPSGLEKETQEAVDRLFRENVITRHETKRLTRDGRVLDVVLSAAFYQDEQGNPLGEVVMLRDITQEKRNARINEALLHISMALPAYPDLEDLLDYLSSEVKHLIGSEGALIVLLDEERQELYFLGAAYDDTDTTNRVKEFRFPLDQLVAGQVIRTGEPLIVPDVPADEPLHRERDRKLGYETRNLLLVPVKSSDRIIGVLCGINKKQGAFDDHDLQLLSLVGGTVGLSIENARFSDELKKAYLEVKSLNRAKDKTINHLSHELKTPVSVLVGSLDILSKRLEDIDEEAWKPTMERARRNLTRIVDIQDEVDDIIQGRSSEMPNLLTRILDQCSDELETLLAGEVGEGPGIERIRNRIEEIYGVRDLVPERLMLDRFVRDRLDDISTLFTHREVEMVVDLKADAAVFIPPDCLRKVVDGLVRNAVENTPDEGRIEVFLRDEEDGPEFVVRDYGVGITEDAQRRIFEGFFATQDTLHYSSKQPYDFNAGGKGADLLRMRIFAERYGFRIIMKSERCRYIPLETDVCPGKISLCTFCTSRNTCLESGGTTFTVRFSRAADPE